MYNISEHVMYVISMSNLYLFTLHYLFIYLFIVVLIVYKISHL